MAHLDVTEVKPGTLLTLRLLMYDASEYTESALFVSLVGETATFVSSHTASLKDGYVWTAVRDGDGWKYNGDCRMTVLGVATWV